MFLVLFVTTGVGNGSTFRMIPVIFRRQTLRAVQGRAPEAEHAALVNAAARARRCSASRRRSAPAAGTSSRARFGASIKATGSAEPALLGSSCSSM